MCHHMSLIARICLLMATAFPLVRIQAASYTFVSFDYPASTGTGLAGINDSGQIVGSFSTATSYGQGFIRNGDGSLVPIVLPYPSTDSPAAGINASGQVVGAFFDPNTFFAQGYLRSTGGTYSIIDDPINPNNSAPSAINDAGLMVGTYSDPNHFSLVHGFLDASGTFTTIDDPNMAANSFGQEYTELSGINNLGQIVGAYTDATGSHGFLRSPTGVFTTIDDPDGNPGTTAINGINNLGVIAGTFTDSSGMHSFIRSADGSTYMTIDDPNGVDTSIYGINDSGEIVGQYFTSLTSGQMNGFIGTPASSDTVPEPVSYALCLAGLAAIACLRLLSRSQP
jgi:uncharacterized membrane protein